MKQRRSSTPLVVSVVVHVVAIIALVQLVRVPGGISWFTLPTVEKDPVRRRVQFVELPPAKQLPAPVAAKAPTPGKPGGNGKPRTSPTPPAPTPPVTVPSGIPTRIPALKPLPLPKDSGTGPLLGTGGPTKGIRPAFTDARIWADVSKSAAALVSTPQAELEADIAEAIRVIADSQVAASRLRKPGDWTIEKNGKKYGVDKKFIHFGSFSLPTALLALLPINGGGNPIVMQREARNDANLRDIREQAMRMTADDAFKRQVKAIRERMDRERAEKKKKEKEQSDTTKVGRQ
jgi:hypothetical protein